MSVRREDPSPASPDTHVRDGDTPDLNARLRGLIIPGTPAWDAQFGRGWTIYVLLAMAALASSFVFLVRADAPVARVHWLAIVVGLFAASFAGAAIYCAVQRIGIPFGFYKGDRLIKERVIHPATHPIGYPLLIASILTIALLAIGAAGWVYTNANSVAEYLLTHAER